MGGRLIHEFDLYTSKYGTNATFHILFFGKILSEQFSLMVKNKKSRDIGETVWMTPYFSPAKS